MFLDGLFSELWFDDEDHSIAVDNIDRNVLYENKLLGVARLHMVSESIIIVYDSARS